MDRDVIIVGAGPAGIGCALALRRAGIYNVLVLEANEVGSSFLKWPAQMRLITPSFHGNPFFQTDLNAITPDTSPGDYSQKEHLSGVEYAKYLKAKSCEKMHVTRFSHLKNYGKKGGGGHCLLKIV